CQRQAVSSATLLEYSRGLTVFTKNSIHQGHQACPSRSFSRVLSCLASKRRNVARLPSLCPCPRPGHSQEHPGNAGDVQHCLLPERDSGRVAQQCEKAV